MAHTEAEEGASGDAEPHEEEIEFMGVEIETKNNETKKKEKAKKAKCQTNTGLSAFGFKAVSHEDTQASASITTGETESPSPRSTLRSQNHSNDLSDEDFVDEDRFVRRSNREKRTPKSYPESTLSSSSRNKGGSRRCRERDTAIRRSTRSRQTNLPTSYVEASSEDEFARKNFMYSSSEDSDSDDDAKSGHHTSNRRGKTKCGEKARDQDNNESNDAENIIDDNCDNDIDGSEGDDESSDLGVDDIEYHIEFVLARKKMTATEWRSICGSMETREVIRGSVLNQPDSEFFDTSPEPIEKFLIKWAHASFLHVTWETEKDIIDLVGPKAKSALNKFRVRENRCQDLFEDLRAGEHFPPAFTRIERIVAIEDDSIDIRSIDWRTAILPPLDSNANSSEEPVPVLHGPVCWVAIKWEGLPYSAVTQEDVNDLKRLNVEYEQALRLFYQREQSTPAKMGAKKIKRQIDPAIMGGNAPTFPAGTLRDYQWVGVRWLLFNWGEKRNSILADEMGLGKTIQAATFLQMLKRHQGLRGPFLIVVPLSTLINWQREILAWTDMDVIVYHGSQEDREFIREHEFFYAGKKKSDGYKIEVVVTTPEVCMTKELTKICWDIVIVDEAHKLKNHESKISSTLRDDFDYRNCILLTGTPLQNNTEELWTLLHFVDKDEFKNREQFMEEFGSLKSTKQVDNLLIRCQPYLLSRKKEVVEKTVPPKEEVIIEVELTVPQKQYYRAIYEQKTGFLYKGGAKDGPSLSNLAMELRKCCNHPFLIKGAEKEMVKHFVDETTTDIMIKSSGKMTLLDKLLPKLQADGHRVLIFSQFRIMLDIIEDYMVAKGIRFERVDGEVTGRKRQAAIDRYTEPSNNIFAMLLSTRAGGVGINLTAADTVIIFDSDWNPQNDIQAQARAHRIGQTRPVKVYRFLTRKTYEMAMFKAASLKLGLDYAIMYNMRGSGGSAGSATGGLEGISADKPAEHSSSLSKRELENLLKHGAYDIFREGKDGDDMDTDNRKFCESDIDQILQRSAVVIHDGNKSMYAGNEGMSSAAAGFSKASFVSSNAEAGSMNMDIAIDDPDFWSKVVGLCEGGEGDEITRKRKCRNNSLNYKEPGYKEFAINPNEISDNSDADSEGGLNRKRAKKDKSAIIKAEWTEENLSKLASSMISRGYCNWEAIRSDSKLRWSLLDIARGCRFAFIHLLYQASSLCSSNKSAETESTSALDEPFIRRYLSKSRACRLAMAAIASDNYRISSSENSIVPIAEDDVLNWAWKTFTEMNASSSNQSEDSSIFCPFFLDTAVNDKDSHFLHPKCYVRNSSHSDGNVTNDSNELNCSCPMDDNFQKVTDNILQIAKEYPSSPSDNNVDDATEKTKESDKMLRSREMARSKLSKLDDLFDIFLTTTGILDGGHRWESTSHPDEQKASEEGNRSGAEDSSQLLESLPSQIHTNHGTLIDALKKRLSTITLFSNGASNPINSAAEDDTEKIDDHGEAAATATAAVTAEDENKQPSWSEENDIHLLRCIAQVGWPEGKRKQSQIVQMLNEAGIESSFVTDGKFLVKRTKELAMTLRGESKEPIGKKMDKKKLEEAANKAEAKAEAKSKKLVKSVLSAIQKLGRPRSNYDALATKLQQQHSANTDAVDATVNIDDRSKYLITWETLAQEVGATSEDEISKVKEIANAIVEARKVMNTATPSVSSSSIVQPDSSIPSQANPTITPLSDSSEISTGLLAGLTNKAIEACCEKADIMHNLRLILACNEESLLFQLIQRNCKAAGPSVHPSRRDLTLPVWWTKNHDLQLLKITASQGLGQWKRIVLDPFLSAAPEGFEMPPRANGKDWETSLTVKTAEKRFNALLSATEKSSLHHEFAPPGSPVPSSGKQKPSIAGFKSVFTSFTANSSAMVHNSTPSCTNNAPASETISDSNLISPCTAPVMSVQEGPSTAAMEPQEIESNCDLQTSSNEGSVIMVEDEFKMRPTPLNNVSTPAPHRPDVIILDDDVDTSPNGVTSFVTPAAKKDVKRKAIATETTTSKKQKPVSTTKSAGIMNFFKIVKQ